MLFLWWWWWWRMMLFCIWISFRHTALEALWNCQIQRMMTMIVCFLCRNWGENHCRYIDQFSYTQSFHNLISNHLKNQACAVAYMCQGSRSQGVALFRGKRGCVFWVIACSCFWVLIQGRFTAVWVVFSSTAFSELEKLTIKHKIHTVKNNYIKHTPEAR